MPAARATALDDLVARHAAGGDWPGGVYAVGPPGREPTWLGCAGRLAVEPREEPAREDALYDLASLTKALVVAPLVVRLAARGVVDPDRPSQDLLPELAGYAGRTPSLADLLLHRAGLPAWGALYRIVSDAAEAPRAIAALSPEAPAGERAVYSCFGPILAGLALERTTGRGLAALFDEQIREPLGIGADELAFGPLDDRLTARCAPTEKGRRREAALAGDGERGREIAPGPHAVLRGEVHDGNARFLGGVAGNAGLFGTAAAVFRVASELAAPAVLFGRDDAERLASPWQGAGGERRTLGFQSGGSDGSPAGRLGPDSFGHVGFTGTSVWIAPRVPLVAVLLTNRVHPAWREAPVQDWRRAFHDLSLAAPSGEAP